MRLKIALISLAVAAVPFAAVPAMSADIDGCASNKTCLWDDNNYQDKLSEHVEGYEFKINLSAANEDRMDSWANNSNTYKSCGYSGQNMTGDTQSWNENSHDDNVSPLNSDEVSSYRTKYGC